MHLIEINMIGLQAAEADFDLLEDMFSRQAGIVGSLTSWEENLGVEDDLSAVFPAFDPGTEYCLRLTFIVCVGGIEKITATLDKAICYRMCGWFFSTPSKSLTAQTDFRDF
jgi:hypothetical protein